MSDEDFEPWGIEPNPGRAWRCAKCEVMQRGTTSIIRVPTIMQTPWGGGWCPACYKKYKGIPDGYRPSFWERIFGIRP